MSRFLKRLAGVMIIAFFPFVGVGADYYVSTSGNDGNTGLSWETAFASPAKAVAAATNADDKIFVAEGTYTLTATLSITAAIEMVSMSGPEKTILRGNGSVSCVTINNAGAVLSGFTVENGKGGSAANIYINNNGGTVTNCHAINCVSGTGTTFSGGIAAMAGLITHSVISNNHVAGYSSGANRAGGVVLYGKSIMRNCLIANNRNDNNGFNEAAGGVRAHQNSVMENCTIVGNVNGTVGGVSRGNNAIVRNCIIWGNIDNAGFVSNVSGASSKYTYCCTDRIDSLGEGCIDANPLFVSGDSSYRLMRSSPCINSGANQDWMAETADLFENDRIIDEIVDMGASEYLNDGDIRCAFYPSSTSGTKPMTVVFTATLDNADIKTTTFEWDFDSNGTADKRGTGLNVVTNLYNEYGTYSVSLKVLSGDKSVSALKKGLITHLPKTTYVWAESQNPQWPYDTPETASTTIQEAIDAVSKDDGMVLVSNGTYNITKTINLAGDITLLGIEGSQKTVVHGNGSVVCMQIDYPKAILSGMTVENGGGGSGANLFMTNSGGTVTNCNLINCKEKTSPTFAGGICAYNGLVTHCIITNNYVSGQRAGGAMLDGNAVMRNCLIANNRSNGTSTEAAGGIFMKNKSVIESCTIVGNINGTAGGLNSNGGETIINCIIWENYDLNNVLHNYNKASEKFTYCCTTPVTSLGTGCTDDNPLIISGDPLYGIAKTSSCSDAGFKQDWMTNSLDIAGNERIYNGIVDIGAVEYLPSMTFSCNFASSVQVGIKPLTVVFTASLENAEPANTTFKWDFDNDGIIDEEGLGLNAVTNSYDKCGTYSVSLKAFAGSGSDLCEQRDYITVMPGTTYAALSNDNAAWPYERPETAATNIQDAVDAVYKDGGIVHVGPGTYALRSRLLLSGKIIMKSDEGAEKTILQGATTSAGVHLSNGATLSGLTVEKCRNGGDYFGANIDVEDGTVSNCIIRSSATESYGHRGGGIALRPGTLINSVVSNNFIATADGTTAYNGQCGAGVYTHGNIGSSRIENCLIVNNGRSLLSSSSVIGAGGIMCENKTTIRNCTIIGNIFKGPAGKGNGGIYGGEVIENCIFADNIGIDNVTTNFEDHISAGAKSNLRYSCLWPSSEDWTDNTGVIVQNPLFRDAANHNYRLFSKSPCVNGGNNGDWTSRDSDLDGNKRIFRKVVDMGCFENQVPRGTRILLR